MNNYCHSFDLAWLQTLSSIVNYGDTVEVRGKETMEILADSVSFPMSEPILTIPARNLSYDFMFAEAWWILTGRNNLKILEKFAPSYKRFSDDGIRLSGAYGPKVVDQIPYVVDTLVNDPHSRQAVINIWRERPGPSKDIPCTLSVQFTVREGKLETFVNMRSNDAWLGMPYDVFAMTMLSVLVCLEVGKISHHRYDLGNMHHYAASRHLYAKDTERAKAIVKALNDPADQLETIRIDMKHLHDVMSDSNMFVQSLATRMNHGDRPRDSATVKNLLPWMFYGLGDARSQI